MSQVSEAEDTCLQMDVTHMNLGMKKSVTLDKKDPERTYKKDWVKSLKQTDEKKHESAARFKFGDSNRSHEERSDDRFSEELNVDFRSWSLQKSKLPR